MKKQITIPAKKEKYELRKFNGTDWVRAVAASYDDIQSVVKITVPNEKVFYKYMDANGYVPYIVTTVMEIFDITLSKFLEIMNWKKENIVGLNHE